MRTYYDYQQMPDIISIIIDCAEEKIDLKTAGTRVGYNPTLKHISRCPVVDGLMNA